MTYSNTDKSLAISAFKTFLGFVPFLLASFLFLELSVAHKDFAMSINKILIMGTITMLVFSIKYAIAHKMKKS